MMICSIVNALIYNAHITRERVTLYNSARTRYRQLTELMTIRHKSE